MFCTNCGKEITEGALFCSGCGVKIGVNAGKIPVYEARQEKGTHIDVGGLIMALVGVAMMMVAGFVIHSDMRWWRYTYSLPFTMHEIVMMTIVGLGFLVMAFGLIDMFTYRRKNR